MRRIVRKVLSISCQAAMSQRGRARGLPPRVNRSRVDNLNTGSSRCPSDQHNRARGLSLLALAALALSTCILGCQTHRQIVDQAHAEFWRGDWDRSAASLAQAIERPRQDLDPLMLDQAMVEFHRGRISESQYLLKEVRDRNQGRPVGQHAVNSLAYFTDESHRYYELEDHEQVILRVMLALNSLMTADGDSIAFAYQIGEQCQKLLESRPPRETNELISFESDTNNSQIDIVASPANEIPEIDSIRRELAVAPLLRSIVRQDSRLHHDEVVRNLQLALEWRPDSQFIMKEFLHASESRQTPPGHGTVYLLALVGRGPRKVEAYEPVSSQALLIADQLLSAVGKYTLPPTVAPIKISKIELSPISVDRLQVSINHTAMGETENIGDIGRLAVERQRELMPQIIARGVARRVVKKGVVVAGKKATRTDKSSKNDLTSLAYDAAGVIWEATEKADLRAWTLLPGSIQILRLDLPAGNHNLTFTPMFGMHPAGHAATTQVNVGDGQVSFCVASVLDAQTPLRVLTPASTQ